MSAKLFPGVGLKVANATFPGVGLMEAAGMAPLKGAGVPALAK